MTRASSFDNITDLSDDDEFYVLKKDGSDFNDRNITWSALKAEIEAETDAGGGGGDGDMNAAVYDPSGVEADAFSMSNMIEGADAKVLTAAERTKLSGVESGATADQTDSEIEAAYNNRVGVVSQAVAEAGTSTTVVRWTPQRVSQAIAALAPSGGGSGDVTVSGTPTSGQFATWTDADTIQGQSLADAVDISSLTTAGAFTSGDYVMIHEAGVGTRKVDYDNLPGADALTASSGYSWNSGDYMRATTTEGELEGTTAVTIGASNLYDGSTATPDAQDIADAQEYEAITADGSNNYDLNDVVHWRGSITMADSGSYTVTSGGWDKIPADRGDAVLLNVKFPSTSTADLTIAGYDVDTSAGSLEPYEGDGANDIHRTFIFRKMADGTKVLSVVADEN